MLHFCGAGEQRKNGKLKGSPERLTYSGSGGTHSRYATVLTRETKRGMFQFMLNSFSVFKIISFFFSSLQRCFQFCRLQNAHHFQRWPENIELNDLTCHSSPQIQPSKNLIYDSLDQQIFLLVTESQPLICIASTNHPDN